MDGQDLLTVSCVIYGTIVQMFNDNVAYLMKVLSRETGVIVVAVNKPAGCGVWIAVRSTASRIQCPAGDLVC